jgi:hypothetical protein
MVCEFHVGELITGRMTLTPLGAPTTVTQPVAYYVISNFSANIGGDYPITSTGGYFTVLNDFGGATDAVKLGVSQTLGMTAATVQGHTPEYFDFGLFYQGNDLTSTDLLPQFVFDSPDDSSNLRFDGNDSIEVRYALTDLSRVPEPSSAALLAIGCAAVWFAHRRRR